MILAALDRVGGQDYLVQQAHNNPKAFMSLLGRLIPTQMTGPDDKELFPVQEMTTAELEARIVAQLMRAGVSEEQARAVIDARQKPTDLVGVEQRSLVDPFVPPRRR
jgi:hypothetical protein